MATDSSVTFAVNQRFNIPKWSTVEWNSLAKLGQEREDYNKLKNEFQQLSKLSTALFGECLSNLTGTIGACVNETIEDPTFRQAACGYIRLHGWFVYYDEESSSFILDLDKCKRGPEDTRPPADHPVWTYREFLTMFD